MKEGDPVVMLASDKGMIESINDASLKMNKRK